MSNIYNVRIEGNLDIKVLVASFGYEYEETFDHLKHAPLEYVAKYFHGGGESFLANARSFPRIICIQTKRSKRSSENRDSGAIY